MFSGSFCLGFDLWVFCLGLLLGFWVLGLLALVDLDVTGDVLGCVCVLGFFGDFCCFVL